MGSARPLGLLLALILPADCDDAEAIARGVGDAAAAVNCVIVGGNISRGSELSITTTVIGSAREPLSRGGARPGDQVYVTGELGGAASAVKSWNSGRDPSPESRRRFA